MPIKHSASNQKYPTIVSLGLRGVPKGPDFKLFLAFSTSGKSNEVIEILELSRHLGVETIIGVTSHPESDLRNLSDFVLDMGVIEEPCPLGLTPSASMAVMLAGLIVHSESFSVSSIP